MTARPFRLASHTALERWVKRRAAHRARTGQGRGRRPRRGPRRRDERGLRTLFRITGGARRAPSAAMQGFPTLITSVIKKRRLRPTRARPPPPRRARPRARSPSPRVWLLPNELFQCRGVPLVLFLAIHHHPTRGRCPLRLRRAYDYDSEVTAMRHCPTSIDCRTLACAQKAPVRAVGFWRFPQRPEPRLSGF